MSSIFSGKQGTKHIPLIGSIILVKSALSQRNWVDVVAKVKTHCIAATKCLIVDLETRFHAFYSMIALLLYFLNTRGHLVQRRTLIFVLMF